MYFAKVRPKKLVYLFVMPVIIIASLVSIGLYFYNKKYVATVIYQNLTSSTETALDWPDYGQAAIATNNYGVVETYGSTEAQPTASVAKIITALAILKKKPISSGSQGETITLSQSDVDLYNTYLSKGGSTVAVQSGETITEYEALEALMLPSSNNMADSLAIWAFGSLENYQKYATEMVKDYNMNSTTIGSDASGFSSDTISTAHDLAILGLKALDNSTLASIVKLKSATIPVAGTIYNVDELLSDHSDVVGIKTGNTDEAGGVFVLGGVQTESGHSQNIVTVVMGASDSNGSTAAQEQAYTLFKSAEKNFEYKTILSTGKNVAYYKTNITNRKAYVAAAKDYRMFVWRSKVPTVDFDLNEVQVGSTGKVGTARIAINGKTITKMTLSLKSSFNY